MSNNFYAENPAVNEIMWKIKKVYVTSRQATHDNIIRRIARSVPKATDTHSEYVILIAFPK